MYRRRRPTREIPFSFDSFLDVVANVNGIILRLILVAWVGARAYDELLPPPTLTEPPAGLEVADVTPPPEPTADDDPLTPELRAGRDELARLRAELLEHLRRADLAAAEARGAAEESAALEGDLARSHREAAALRDALAAGARADRAAALSLEEFQARTRELAAELAALKAAPPVKKTVRFPAPRSQEFQAEELHVEVQRGRVTPVDQTALYAEVQRMVRARIEAFRDRWEYTDVTPAVGPYRLHFTAARVRTDADVLAPPGGPVQKQNYQVELTSDRLEPLDADRGEPAGRALQPASAFRRAVDGLDPRRTVVTLWVYPDSFAAYRALRDYLHGQGFVVAGRPLPDGAPIASSRSGTRSRGQ